MRRSIFSVLMVLALALPAEANDFAVVLGLRSNNADAANAGAGVTTSGSTGFQAGVLGFYDFSGALGMRAGFLYAQRNYTITASGSNLDAKFGYFDIPATLTFKIADYARLFAGPLLALNVSHKCDVSGGGTCSITKNPDSMSLGLEFGASFKFAPQFGAELYYEMIPGEIWDGGLKDAKTVGANLLITFE